MSECAEIFYLVLRGLDTLEDDPVAFQNKEDRIEALKSFHTHLNDPNWNRKGIGEGHEPILLENFDSVIRTFLKLKEFSICELIEDITRKMGDGMAETIGQKLDGTQGMKTMEDYNKYCYYASGLVGEGLFRVFTVSDGNIDKTRPFTEIIDLVHASGKFMQKINIIRDFSEDYLDGRSFWPLPIWSKYVSSLGDLFKPENSKVAVNCLNELVVDALDLLPYSLRFLSLVTNKNIIPFVAIILLRALDNLSKLYDNPNVFTGVVKIRQGLVASITYNFNDIDLVLEESLRQIEEILDKTDHKDVLNRSKILVVINSVKKIIKSRAGIKQNNGYSFLLYLSFGIMASAFVFIVLSKM